MHIPSFPTIGFVRLSAILAPTGPICVSKSTWWAGAKSGRFPRPVKHLPRRITARRAEDITTLLEFPGEIASHEPKGINLTPRPERGRRDPDDRRNSRMREIAP